MKKMALFLFPAVVLSLVLIGQTDVTNAAVINLSELRWSAVSDSLNQAIQDSLDQAETAHDFMLRSALNDSLEFDYQLRPDGQIIHAVDAANTTALQIIGNRRATAVDGDDTKIEIYMTDDLGDSVSVAEWGIDFSDVTNTSKDSYLWWKIRRGNALREILKMTGTLTLFNVDQDDIDFSVNYDNGQAFFVDGATGRTSVMEMLLDNSGQDYLFRNPSALTSWLGIQGQSAGTGSTMALFSADGDSTDNVEFRLVGQGTPSNLTNRTQLIVRYIPGTGMQMQSEAEGTGVLQPLSIETEGNTGQLYLGINGNVGVGTKTPQQKLSVLGAFSATDTTGVKMSPTSTWADSAAYFAKDSDGNMAAHFVDSSGNIAKILSRNDSLLISASNIHVMGLLTTDNNFAIASFDSSSTPALLDVQATTWAQVTNLTNDLWEVQEASGVTVSADSLISSGTHHFDVSATIDVKPGNNKDLLFRFNTNGGAINSNQVLVQGAATALYSQAVLLGHWEPSAPGDALYIEVYGVTDGTDALLYSGYTQADPSLH